MQATDTTSGRRTESETKSQKTCHRPPMAPFPRPEEGNEATEMRYWKSVNLVLIGMTVSVVVSAQEMKPDTTVHALEQVEVEGRRVDQSLTATVPTQTLTASDFMPLGISSLTDALKHLTGITVKDYGGAGGMKTVSVRGLGSRHTAVIYDGIALNDCQTGEIDLARYGIEGMESIQLVVGEGDRMLLPARNIASAAQLYLNSSTPSADDLDLHVKAHLGVGSWGLAAPAVMLSRRVSPQLSLSGKADYTHADNRYPFMLRNVGLLTREKRSNSKMDNGHVEMDMQWQPNSANRIEAKLYYYDNDRQLPGIVRYYTQENDETLHDRNAFGQIVYHLRPSASWDVMALGKINWASTSYHNGMPTGGIADAYYIQRESYGSLATTYAPLSWLVLGYSADYINTVLESQRHPMRHSLLHAASMKVRKGGITIVGRLLQSLHKDSQRSGMDVSEQSSVSASPATHHETTKRISPSLSVSYQPFRHHQIAFRAMWKEIFRMPTFNERYYYHIGSTELRPEKTRQFNLGMTAHTPIGRWVDVTGSADIYINKVSEKIVAIPFNMFVWRMMNVASVKSRGVDLNFSVDRKIGQSHQLTLTQQFSWQNVVNKSTPSSPYYGNQIAYTPEHTFATTLTWLNPWANLTLTTDGMTHRWTTNEHSQGTRIGGFAELGIGAFRTFHLSKTTITARISSQNILNKQYEIVGHYPMPGCSWKASVTVEW